MKKLVLFCYLLLGSMAIALAQTPQGFKYQAVARDAGGNIIKNQVVGLRISLLQGGPNGTVIYSELHSPTSSNFGVFSLTVGQGILQLGNFTGINWGADKYWMMVEMDANGGNNYQIMGSSELLAVPYALHAQTVEENDDADADPANELQNLMLNGTVLSIEDGNAINLASIIPQGGNDNQILSLNGTNLTIENGNTVNLNVLQDGVNDADADPGNEIQVLSKTGNTVNLSNGGGSFIDAVNDADADPGNEIQTLSLSGTQIEISNGNTINLAPILPPGGTDDQTITLNGTNLSIEDGNTIDLSVIQDGVNDADADPANEIQTLSLSGTQIEISNGNTINLAPILPPGGTDDQTITLNGTNLSIEDGNTIDLSVIQDGVNDADADPANEIQTLSLSGTQIEISNGNTINLAPILPPGGTDDQTITLNGTNLSIEDGNTIDLSVIQDGVNDADADPANEIQTLSKNGNIVSLSNGGGSFTDAVNDADSDASNELQSLTLNGTQIQISSGNSIDLAPIIPQGGSDDQILSLNGTSLSIEDGNSIDLSPISSPWLPASFGGIYYDAGIVFTERQQIDSSLQVGNNTPTSTNLDVNGVYVDYYNLNGSTSSLNGDNLYFSKDAPTNRHTQLGIDSLEFFRENVGLLFSSKSTLDPDYLTFEYGPSRTEVNAGSIWNTSGTFISTLIPHSMSISEEQGSIYFDRVRLEPDSLTLWNDTKWKNAWLGTESSKGNGSLRLFNGSNDMPIVRIGDADHDNIFGGPPEGGVFLYDETGDAKASLTSSFGSGVLFVEDGSTFASAGQGGLSAGNLDPSGGPFDFVTHKFLAGVENRTGYMKIFDDYNPFDQAEPKAGMKVDFGEGCIYSDGSVKIKYPNSSQYSSQMSYYEFALYDSTGAAAASISRDFFNPQMGYVSTFGDNFSLNFRAGPNFTGLNNSGGSAIVFDSFNEEKAGMEVDLFDNGHLFAVNGEHQIRDNLSNRWAYTDKYGYNLMDTGLFSSFVASLYRYPGEDNTGTLFLGGDQGSINVFAGHNIFSASPTALDKGYLSVGDESSLHRAGIFVNDANQGVVFGDVKNFRMQHPKDPSKEIWYASLEGPEAAAYIRGTATLQNGEVFVRFADHFLHVSNPGTMTVVLTPLSTDTYGLAVVEKTAEGIRVKELKGGTGNFSFDWEVKCVRAGFEHFEPVRERKNIPVRLPSKEQK